LLGWPSDSATSTSPFGSTYGQRGLESPSANSATLKPCGGCGIVPFGQPTTFAKRVAALDGSGGGSFLATS
jgi:hypothetical protein